MTKLIVAFGNVSIATKNKTLFIPKSLGFQDKQLDGYNILIFFLSALQNLEQRAKKCIELRGEYVE